MSDAKNDRESGWIEGIDPRLEVLSAAPLVLQTPVELLAGQRITDKSALFVRNCQDLDTALTLDPVTWASAMSIWGIASKIVLFLIQYATMRAIGVRRGRAAASI